MARPTREDAHLLLELAQWFTALGGSQSLDWIRSDEFVKGHDEFEKRYPHGSPGRMHVNNVLGYHETVGTLWKNRLLNEELLFDWLWVVGSWDLVSDIAIGMRKKSGVDALWENYEAMAERQRALLSGSSPRKAAAKKAAPAKKASRPRAAAKRPQARRSASSRRR